jgi:hypothetical protein
LSLVAAAVSLLVCMATIVLWAVNRRRMECIQYRTHAHSYLVTARPGGVYFAVSRRYLDPVPPQGWNSKLRDRPPGWHAWIDRERRFSPTGQTLEFPGIITGAFDAYTNGPDHARVRYVVVWYPCLTLGFNALTILFGMPLWRRWRSRARGRCPACGYNLAGNISGVCPECGAGIPTESAAHDSA